MGIIVKNENKEDDLLFYVKGADDVMSERIEG